MGYVSCMTAPEPNRPSWDRLFATAARQEGYFTTGQAAEAGFSTQLLHKHIKAGRVTRAQRGVYRLVHFVAGEHEELVTVWLWSAQAGVFSHHTALSLHGLSDALPSQLHLTLPAAWRKRRLRVPPDVVLHHADVTTDERSWFGPVPATSALRTLRDCAAARLAPDLLRDAARQAMRRGLVTRNELGDVAAVLEPFGGLAS